MKKSILLIVFVITSTLSWCAEINVGIASKVITPQLPFWMTGFGSRTKPAEGVIHDLWAKVLVFEESPGNRVAIVTTDILGFSHEISEAIASKVNQKFGIKRSQLLLNSSHTHSGPVIWPQLSVLFDLNQADQQIAARYTTKLTDDIVDLIDSAINNIKPMKVWSGHGTAGFAMNRREVTAKGIINGKNPDGPVDHDVPVLKVTTPDGVLKAILFGYACHNTSINNYQINGDYAGFAQIELEKAYPGVTAMFFMGCGADQNPQPRGTIELTMQHGKSLAGAVQKSLSGDFRPVRLPIRTDFMNVGLEFLPFDLKIYQEEILSKDIYVQRRAKLMLEAYNKGWDVSRFNYPIQVIRFNNDLTFLAMSGEVVVDYSLKMKAAYANENIFMGGYCNEVMCYIPTQRVIKEGGYEPDRSMIYYGLPGPFADNAEEKILSGMHRMMKKVGAKRKSER